MPDPVAFGMAGRHPASRPLLRTTIGEVLRLIRLAQGRTLAEVARAARVSMPYLSELERGRKEASSEVLAAICDALEVELADLLAEVGQRLAAQAGRHGTVVELAAFRTRRAAPPQRGPGDVQCLLAA